MIDTTTENFWKAWAEPQPEPQPVFHRLYYNEQGMPVCYTMEDLPGQYIEVDRDIYVLGSLNVRVINGQLKILQQSSMIEKLQPSDTGTPCDPRDVCVVVSQQNSHTFWNSKHNEITS
jgi:hypothetical protein